MLRSPLPLLATLALTGAVAASAQTKSTTTAHRTTSTTAHHPAAHTTTAAKPGCVALPQISPRIPAVPAASPCGKALFTVSERLDYMSPLVGPNVREGFSNLPMTFSLDYIDTQVGTGEPVKPHMYFTVQYTGYLPDGTKFDSSLDHPDKEPITFPYGAHRVIPGWDLGFEGMRVGGKRRLFIPYQLGYGERGQPGHIPPRSELIFDMQLISQSEQAPQPKTPPTPPTPATPSTAPGAAPQPGSLPATPPTGAAPASSTVPVSPSAPASPAAPGAPPASPQPPTTPH